MGRLPSRAVLPLLVALLFLPVAWIEWSALRHTGGHWSYPLDDSFIHMAIARNLAFHHTWGINAGEFSSTSSSLLYTALLAGVYRIFGASMLAPFVLNALAGVALLWVAARFLRREGAGPWAQVLILGAAIFLTPLPTLIVTGMEHTLQCLFFFGFLTAFAAWASSDRTRLPLSLLLWTLGCVTIRYEGVFPVAVACGLLLLRGRWKVSFLLGAVALAPLVLFGLFSVHEGSYFLPNSVLLKSDTTAGAAALLKSVVVDRLALGNDNMPGLSLQHLLIILPVLYFVLKPDRRRSDMLAVLTGATLLHLALAAEGWFYRYEAYLIFNATVVVGVLLTKQPWRKPSGFPAWALASVAVLALAVPYADRSAAALGKASTACTNIYDQQYQMGLFLRENYPGQPVAANDIGAISYLAPIHTLDLWGLGNIDVARSRRNHTWTPAFLDSLTRSVHAPVAVVFDSWFDTALLNRWEKVGAWRIPDNVVCGSDTVSFYAVDPDSAAGLRERLIAWKAKLPPGVTANTF